MIEPRLEVAEVFRAHEAEYLRAHGATAAQRQVLRAVQNCRTAALGGHVEACDHCDHQPITPIHLSKSTSRLFQRLLATTHAAPACIDLRRHVPAAGNQSP